ncbi:conserved phage C-terminal domain-containing protein [Bacillus pfraonensis]|uniref:conserved phage C-terminal domain-containing protein n=1 Tax=Bacillus pfraonensis TaxID=2830844 RepID=UPI003D6F6FA1
MSNYNTIRTIISQISGQENIVVVPKLFVKLTGDLTTAILLNQIVFYSDKSKRTDGFFYKTYKEWEEEICLTERQVRYSTKKLVNAGFVETTLKKANGAPTVHYKLDFNKLLDSILTNCQNGNLQIVGMEPDKTSESLTEITTENTTKNNICAAKADTKKKPKKNSYSDDFEEIWSIYPKKRNKPKAYQRYKEALDKDHSHEDIKHGIACYAKDCEKQNTELQYIKMLEGFLNDERYLEYKKTEPKQKKQQTAISIDNLLD